MISPLQHPGPEPLCLPHFLELVNSWPQFPLMELPQLPIMPANTNIRPLPVAARRQPSRAVKRKIDYYQSNSNKRRKNRVAGDAPGRLKEEARIVQDLCSSTSVSLENIPTASRRTILTQWLTHHESHTTKVPCASNTHPLICRPCEASLLRPPPPWVDNTPVVKQKPKIKLVGRLDSEPPRKKRHIKLVGRLASQSPRVDNTNRDITAPVAAMSPVTHSDPSPCLRPAVSLTVALHGAVFIIDRCNRPIFFLQKK